MHPGFNPFDPSMDHGVIISLYLAELLDDCAMKGTGPYLMDRGHAAISYFYQQAGFLSPLAHPWCVCLMKVAHRLLSAKPLVRQPLTVESMYKVLYYHFWGEGKELNSLRTLMHLTILLLAFVGFFRYDDMSNILVHEDLLRFIPTSNDPSLDDGVLIFLPHSKTDQAWSGNWVAIGATGGAFCPVMLLRKLLFLGGYCSSHQKSVKV